MNRQMNSYLLPFRCAYCKRLPVLQEKAYNGTFSGVLGNVARRLICENPTCVPRNPRWYLMDHHAIRAWNGSNGAMRSVINRYHGYLLANRSAA